MKEERFFKILTIAGLIIVFGLVVVAVTLIWGHPVSFVIFIIFGGITTVVGMVLYLYLIVTRSQPSQ